MPARTGDAARVKSEPVIDARVSPSYVGHAEEVKREQIGNKCECYSVLHKPDYELADRIKPEPLGKHISLIDRRTIHLRRSES